MGRVPAAFGLVYLALFLLFLSLMRSELRRRVCTRPPEPAGAAHQGYRQRVAGSASAEATAEARQREVQAPEEAAEEAAQADARRS
jgi:hypothetical protein